MAGITSAHAHLSFIPVYFGVTFSPNTSAQFPPILRRCIASASRRGYYSTSFFRGELFRLRAHRAFLHLSSYGAPPTVVTLTHTSRENPTVGSSRLAKQSHVLARPGRSVSSSSPLRAAPLSPLRTVWVSYTPGLHLPTNLHSLLNAVSCLSRLGNDMMPPYSECLLIRSDSTAYASRPACGASLMVAPLRSRARRGRRQR